MRKHWTLIVPGALLLSASPAFAVELREAVQAALNTNPDIRQAIHNKEATREEAHLVFCSVQARPSCSVMVSRGIAAGGPPPCGFPRRPAPGRDRTV